LRLTNDGLTLWTDAPDAPANPGSVTVGVSPAHIANAVEVRVRVDGGPERVVRGLPRPGLPGEAQYFVAALPFAPPGARVEAVPTAMCAGRRCPAPGDAETLVMRREPGLVVPAMATALKTQGHGAATGERFGYTMEFLGTVWVTLKPPEVIGPAPQGLRLNYYITDGRCEGPRLNATILPEGGDWMLVQRNGVALPGVRTTWKTDDGALLYGEYSGVFDLGPEGYARALEQKYPDLPVVQLTPRFVTTDPRYEWINRRQCLGVGAVHMDLLRVEYDLYATGTGSKHGEPKGR